MDERKKQAIVWENRRREKLAGTAAARILHDHRGSASDLFRFASLLNNPDRAIRAQGIRSLMEHGGRHAAAMIARSTDDVAPEVRVLACAALGKLRSHDHKTRLYDCLYDRILVVVCESCIALELLGDRAGYDRLTNLLAINGDHQMETLKAFNRLSRQRFPLNKKGLKEALRWIKTRSRVGA